MSVQTNQVPSEYQAMLFDVAAPLATEADFNNPYLFQEIDLYATSDNDGYIYTNAATCPDCAGDMIRQGRCCVCPSCGYESCLM
jgi:hypothetical protein